MNGTRHLEPWRLRAHDIESCNCNTGCGCKFGGLPDYGFCEGMHGIEVIEGHYGSVQLAGCRAVFCMKWPGPAHEGHGVAVVSIDESARPGQVDALWRIFSGQAGGMPWEEFAATFERIEGPISANIEMKIAGRKSECHVDGIVDVALRPLADPVTGKDKRVQIVYPEGTGKFWHQGEISTTTRMSISHSVLMYQHPGQFAAYAMADWTNQK